MQGVEQGEGERKLLLVQTLRAAAALLVVGEHISDLLAQRMRLTHFVFANGSSGVDIFFVISGLVMVVSSQPLVHRSNPGGTFFRRRLERIVPLYWIATTLALIFNFALPQLAANGRPALWRVVASYFFLPSARGTPVFPVLAVGWTLNYEMVFYVFFACALGLRVSPLRVLTPALGTIAVIAFLAKPGVPGVVVYEDRIVLEFLYGVVLGMAVVAGRVPGKFWSAVMAVSGFAVLLTMEPTFTMTRPLIWGIPALAIVAGAIGLERTVGQRVPGWILEIGDASYAIYLFHGFVLPVVGMALMRIGLSKSATVVLAVAAGMLGSTLAGVAIHRAIEVPMAGYFRQRRKPAVAANA
jgi:peptidoglycan/LPS O-acetylase OafA/YrhL